MHRQPPRIIHCLAIAVLPLLACAAAADDRAAEFQKLDGEYKTEEKAFFEAPVAENMTTAEQIRRYEAFPAWRYLPRFLKLAEARPEDETAFQCCQWIIDRTRNVGNRDEAIFPADQKAWRILTAHHTNRADLPTLCLRATEYSGAAQERFLRALLQRKDISRENLGFATIALGEALRKRHDLIEEMADRPTPRSAYAEYRDKRKAADKGRDLIPANSEKFKHEAMQLFREVLAHYADIPVTISAPGFRRLNNLGQKAEKSLHALEHLTIGSKAPDIVGKDLQGRLLTLDGHANKVVVISFWFTGCGPCMGMIPQERELIEKYKDRPFALLSVCTDESLEEAGKTAAENGIDWPCWFDGQNGPIARDWNVLAWPTIYILDRDGRIVARDLQDADLDAKISELLDAE